MELYGPQWIARAGISGKADIVGAGDDMTVLRNGRDRVAVAHPHLGVGLEVLKQGIREVDGAKVGTTVFARTRLLHLSAIGVGDILSAVADTQHGVFAHKFAQVAFESLLVINRIGTAT